MKKTETETSLGSQINATNTQESKDMLSKSYKNRDFPLMITNKKTVRDGEIKKKEPSPKKDEKNDLVSEDKEIKETEKKNDNGSNLNNNEVKELHVNFERESKQGESLLFKELHSLSEVQ